MKPSVKLAASVCALTAVSIAGCNTKAPATTSNSPAVTSDVQFVNVTEQSGIGGYSWTPREKRPLTILGTIGNGAAFIDVDNDDNLDILLVGKKTTLFRGDGNGKFTEDPAALGNPQGYFLGCAVGDYDNDGFQDIYLTGYRDGRLYKNMSGKKFTDVTASSGLTKQPWGTSASFADFNRDGVLDLYVANYAIFGPKVMIINERAGSGGDLLPYMFKKSMIGPLIGTRTWGGLVGTWDTPRFLDGGRMVAPRGGFFDTDGRWAVEGEGISPDIEVLQDPAAVLAGKDPQLERAVQEALKLLETKGVKLKEEPAPPVRWKRPEGNR